MLKNTKYTKKETKKRGKKNDAEIYDKFRNQRGFHKKMYH